MKMAVFSVDWSVNSLTAFVRYPCKKRRSSHTMVKGSDLQMRLALVERALTLRSSRRTLLSGGGAVWRRRVSFRGTVSSFFNLLSSFLCFVFPLFLFSYLLFFLFFAGVGTPWMGPEGWCPEGWEGPKFRVFSLFRHIYHSFFPLLGGR